MEMLITIPRPPTPKRPPEPAPRREWKYEDPDLVPAGLILTMPKEDRPTRVRKPPRRLPTESKKAIEADPFLLSLMQEADRTRWCGVCGATFTLASTTGTWECWRHTRPMDHDGIYPCCGLESVHGCTPADHLTLADSNPMRIDLQNFTDQAMVIKKLLRYDVSDRPGWQGGTLHRRYGTDTQSATELDTLGRKGYTAEFTGLPRPVQRAVRAKQARQAHRERQADSHGP